MAFSLFLLLFAIFARALSQDQCLVPDSPSETKVNVAYFIWVGTEVHYGLGITIEVADNSSLYHVMEAAANLYPDSHSFEAECSQWGHYITSIGGNHEDQEARNHWLIYKVDGVPAVYDPPTPEQLTPFGVDKTYVSQGDYYLFWLRNTDFLVPPSVASPVQ